MLDGDKSWGLWGDLCSEKSKIWGRQWATGLTRPRARKPKEREAGMENADHLGLGNDVGFFQMTQEATRGLWVEGPRSNTHFNGWLWLLAENRLKGTGMDSGRCVHTIVPHLHPSVCLSICICMLPACMQLSCLRLLAPLSNLKFHSLSPSQASSALISELEGHVGTLLSFIPTFK